MLFYQLKLSLHLAAFGVQLLALRCGRGHATQVAASVGAFASPQEADQFIEAKAGEFKQLSPSAQSLQTKRAATIRQQVLNNLGQVMKERGLLPTDPAEATEKLKRLQHGLPHGKTTEGMATLYGFGELTEKVMERHTATKPATTAATTTAATPSPAAPKNGKPAAKTANTPATIPTPTPATSTAVGVAKGGGALIPTPTATPANASATVTTAAEARLAALREKMARFPLPPGSRRAVEEYAPNRARCRNCGQYASIQYGHVCPMTANGPTFDKALQRRMKLPTGAFSYVDGESGNRVNGLQTLIDEARTEPHQVEFVNPATGEIVKTTLDGSMLALQQGLVPHQWLVASRPKAKGKTKTTLAPAPLQVLTPTGAVAWVLDRRGLPAPTTPETPIEAAALASGLEPWMVRAATPTSTSAVSSTAATTATSAGLATATATAATIPTPARIVTTAPTSTTLTLIGGSEIDAANYNSHDWNKKRGTILMDDTVTPRRAYLPLSSSRNRVDFSRIRHAGLHGPTPSRKTAMSIGVGDSLVEAAILLKKNKIVKTTDGKIEVHNEKDGFIAIYDPATNQFGSVYKATNDTGQPSTSPEQWAAFMAAVLLDPNTPSEQNFGIDVMHYFSDMSPTSALAVADGANILIGERFKAGQTFKMGNTIGGVTNCPNCGKFVGAAPCPCGGVSSSSPTTAASPSAATPIPAAAATAATSVLDPALDPAITTPPAPATTATATTTPTSASSLATAAVTPVVAAAASSTASVSPSLTLSGGSDYDEGRFGGGEWRKGRGEYIIDDTMTPPKSYRVGDSRREAEYYSAIRYAGLYPGAPVPGFPAAPAIKVGNNLVKAAIMLKKSQAVKTPDGKVELRNDTDGLIAVYDPETNQFGSTYEPINDKGQPCASPEQWAAFMAAVAADPKTATEEAFARDVRNYLEGTGDANALAVSDGAYILLKRRFENGETFSMGNTIGGAIHCPNCGKFVGAAPCPCGGVSGSSTSTSSSPTSPTATATSPASPDPAPSAATTTTTTTTTPSAPAPALADPTTTPGGSESTADDTTPDLSGEVSSSGAVNSKAGAGAGSEETSRVIFDSATFARTFAETLAPLITAKEAATGTGTKEVAEALTKVGAALEGMAEMERRMTTVLDRVADKVSRTAAVASAAPSPAAGSGSANVSGAATTAPTPTPPAAPTPKPVEPAPLRPPKDKRNRTGVDNLLAEVDPPGPTDPYLMSVPPELGGQRIEPLPQYHQELDENYELTTDAANAIKTVAASLKIAWNPDPARRPRGTQFRAFAFGGTSGTGKNTTARQIAAALGQPYYELTINKDTSIQEEIGQTVLTTDPVSGATISKAQLGKLGQAAASGAVICVNELVKANPGILGALQTMTEDGYIEIAGTEAGMAGGRIPVHPNTVFIGTWNPGYDGAAQRPDQALLSRMQTVMLNAPSIEQQTSRLQKEMNRLFGPGKVSKAKCEAAAKFLSDVQRMARGGVGIGREIAKDSPFPVEPTPREIARFLATAEMTGDPLLALEQFKTYADAGEDFEDQWKRIKTVFSRHFGDDGQALNRKEAGKGPKME